jgi:hypothetical protein
VRTGAYEKRASKKLVPITKEMEEGKEAMRTFGDLLQFVQKKKEPPTQPPASPPEVAPAFATAPSDETAT